MSHLSDDPDDLFNVFNRLTLSKRTPRHISFPAYLLPDTILNEYIRIAQEVMLELAGEQEADELPLFIEACRAELNRRGPQ